MKSSIRSAVVFGSTVTGLSWGGGGAFTLAHSAMTSAACAVDDDIAPPDNTAANATALETSRLLLMISSVGEGQCAQNLIMSTVVSVILLAMTGALTMFHTAD